MDLALHASRWCLVSVFSASVLQVQTWDTTFYRNVRAEAIEVP